MDPQEQAGDSHAVDIASLAQELMKVQAATSSSEARLRGGSLLCPIIIGKVDDLTRNVDPEEYDPHHVSIGPYHRGTNLFRDQEKRRSVSAVLSAASQSVTVKDYLKEMDRLKEHARRCYQHEFMGISDEDFVRMMLLDACYLLAMFGISNYDQMAKANSNGHVQGQGGHQSGGESLLSVASSGSALRDIQVVCDVFYLVENQLPFFLIDRIHQLSKMEGSASAAEIISKYIRKLLVDRQYSVAEPDVATPPGNLLHLLHMHLKPTLRPPTLTSTASAAAGNRMGRWRSVTDYCYLAGVKFKKQSLSRVGCQSILDVRLVDDGGTLEIPVLNIDGNTWRLLRNLIALEQHNSGTTGSDVTAYCFFMSQLACTPPDIELLSRRGVISHTCGNHGNVAHFFSELCNGVVERVEDEESNYLRGTWQALEMRFRSRRLRWMAWLRQKYFRNPWLTVGLAAAGVGLVCTVVQAVYSVLSYKH